MDLRSGQARRDKKLIPMACRVDFCPHPASGVMAAFISPSIRITDPLHEPNGRAVSHFDCVVVGSAISYLISM